TNEVRIQGENTKTRNTTHKTVESPIGCADRRALKHASRNLGTRLLDRRMSRRAVDAKVHPSFNPLIHGDALRTTTIGYSPTKSASLPMQCWFKLMLASACLDPALHRWFTGETSDSRYASSGISTPIYCFSPAARRCCQFFER
ncbi:hypothetical protein HAX54_041249, partial [Datura stramonium]|nr:hypothetical protein [Datura stramonium]